MAPPIQHRDSSCAGKAAHPLAIDGGGEGYQGSWDEYRMHVIQSLNRIDDTLEKLWQGLSDVKRDVTSLKIRVAVWSAGFGFVGAAIPIVLDAFLRYREIVAR
jgi:hypothetical protein